MRRVGSDEEDSQDGEMSSDQPVRLKLGTTWQVRDPSWLQLARGLLSGSRSFPQVNISDHC